MSVKRRFNTSLPESTYEYLKEFADRYCMTMGSAVAVIVEQYRMQQNVSQGFAAISKRSSKSDNDNCS